MCEVKFGPNARGVQMVEPLGSLYRANTVHEGTTERASGIEASQQQRVWLVLLVIQVRVHPIFPSLGGGLCSSFVHN
jgi:hypothetical protein